MKKREKEGRPPKQLRTLRNAFGEKLRLTLEQASTISFAGLTKYYDDPVGFMHDIIGCETWSKQDEMLLSIRDHDRVSVRASQKASKDHSAAAIALWWLCTRSEARCVFTAPTFRQTQHVLYRQLKQHIASVQKRYPGLLDNLRVAELCDTGIQTEDYTDLRSINGFVSHDTGGLQGISAPAGKLLVIIDEASHVSADVYLALDANLAAGGKMFVISNPLNSHGWFFDSHNKNAQWWHLIHISAEMNPNYIHRRTVISGLATYDYVERKRREWGPDSFQFKTRIQGEFAIHESGKMFPHARLLASIEAWPHASMEGKLCIGVDPAGAGESGDETAICAVRGKRMIELVVERGLTEQMILDKVKEVATRLAVPGEKPEVRLDVEGKVGATVLGLARAQQGPYVLVEMRAHKEAVDKKTYALLRDELAAHFEKWVKEGGAILDDDKLLEECSVMEWGVDLRGRNKLIHKKELAKIIYRSPDRFDAACLAVYQSQVGSYRDLLQRQLDERKQVREGSRDKQWAQQRKTGRRALYGR